MADLGFALLANPLRSGERGKGRKSVVPSRLEPTRARRNKWLRGEIYLSSSDPKLFFSRRAFNDQGVKSEESKPAEKGKSHTHTHTPHRRL